MELKFEQLKQIIKRAQKIGAILTENNEADFDFLSIDLDGEMRAHFSNRYDDESITVELTDLVNPNEEQVLQDAKDYLQILKRKEEERKRKVEQEMIEFERESKRKQYELLKKEFEGD